MSKSLEEILSLVSKVSEKLNVDLVIDMERITRLDNKEATMSHYAYIQAGEDGEIFNIIDSNELEALLKNPREDYGITQFVGIEDIPKAGIWCMGVDKAIIIKFEVLIPKEVTKEYILE